MQFVCLHHSIRSTFANWSIKLFELVALAKPQLSTISIINTLHRSLTIYWNCMFFEAENRPLICLIRIKTIQVFSVCSIIYTILSRVWLNSSSIIDFNTLSSCWYWFYIPQGAMNSGRSFFDIGKFSAKENNFKLIDISKQLQILKTLKIINMQKEFFRLIFEYATKRRHSLLWRISNGIRSLIGWKIVFSNLHNWFSQ